MNIKRSIATVGAIALLSGASLSVGFAARADDLPVPTPTVPVLPIPAIPLTPVVPTDTPTVTPTPTDPPTATSTPSDTATPSAPPVTPSLPAVPPIVTPTPTPSTAPPTVTVPDVKSATPPATCTVVTQQTPSFNTKTGVLTLADVSGDHYSYQNADTHKVYAAGATQLKRNQTADVKAVADQGYCFAAGTQAEWSYTYHPSAPYAPQVAVSGKSVKGGVGQVSIAFHYKLVAPATSGKVIVIATAGDGTELYRKTISVSSSGSFSHVVKNAPVGKVTVTIQPSLNSGGSASETPDVVEVTGPTVTANAAKASSSSPSEQTLPIATSSNPRGWGDLQNGTWTAGGIQLTATATQEAFAYVDVPHFKTFKLSDMGNNVADASGSYAFIFQVAGEQWNIHHETDGTWWTPTAGLFANGGPGYYYAPDLNNLLADPSITEVAVWVNPGASALVKSVTYNGKTQPFGEVVKDAAGNVTVALPTCTANGSASLGYVNHASLVGTLDESVGSHTATFKADNGYAFADGSATHTVTYKLDAKLPSQSTDKSAACYVTPSVPNTPATSVVASNGGSSTPLADTGSNILPLGLAGLAALLIGVSAYFFSRIGKRKES